MEAGQLRVNDGLAQLDFLEVRVKLLFLSLDNENSTQNLSVASNFGNSCG
jgi:hypothetical protein